MKTFHQSKAEAQNKLAKYINKVAPLIQARLAEGFKQKNDGSLFKKDKDQIELIIGDWKTIKPIRVYLDVSSHSICLRADIYYHFGKPDLNGISSGAYFKEYTYLWNTSQNTIYNFEVLGLATAKKYDNAKAEMIKLVDQKSDIDSQIGKLKRFLHL